MDIYEGKRQHPQESVKSSRSSTPDLAHDTPPEGFRPVQRTPPPDRVRPPPSPPVPTHPIAPVSPEPSEPLPLKPCPVCGRTFVPQSLSKHVNICQKMTVKKRKLFDSSRQRREGTDLEQFLPKNFGLPENSPFLEKSPPATAKPAPKPKCASSVKSVITKSTSELQRCPHCNRAFGMRAFERHVEWCADKAKILPATHAQQANHISDAKQRLNARTKYKAPPVRGRRSSLTREKSSNSRSASVESSRGVSPPPPPREYGDYKHGRTRASESMSSNDYHEESPHVPVIRNGRNIHGASSGDANVKARQARLARDLSSSRLDDNYDPFASAARQMKELMSSDTNLPKKVQDTCKDPNRTLPILRPKDKPNLSCLRSDNTKMIKDSLNKTYQKTPTLQRLKSFGGTNNENQNNTFSGRCSSFRINRNDKKATQKLNSTFTKSSKENIVTAEKNYFNRNSNLNRSFSSYTASAYSTPKPKEKVPKITTSMYHSFQRTTIKQPVKLDKIKKDDDKKGFVNLDSILIDDNSSMTDSNYIDPRLINENDNLPINVNTILNNPDILSSMESLLTQHKDILPTKFESFSSNIQNNNKDCNDVKSAQLKIESLENNINNNVNSKIIAPLIDDLSIQYDKIMSSLEQSIDSKTSIRDDDSLCEDFDLEEFMTSFDEEVNKQKLENKRTCSSTTRVVKPAELSDCNKPSVLNDNISSPKVVVSNGSNGLLPVNKSMSINFSSNNIVSENLFPPSMKRSNSLLDSVQKKTHKSDNGKNRHKNDQLDEEFMHSLKEFDKYYETQRIQSTQSSKEANKVTAHNGTTKRDSRGKSERKIKKGENVTNGHNTPYAKSSDSAYSSLNRISPSKLSVCNSKSSNGVASLEQIPAESDSSGYLKDDVRSMSSDEFLAMERSTELGETKEDTQTIYKESENHEKRVSSRASSRQSTKWRPRQELSSSGSEASLPRPRRNSSTAPSPPVRMSRFCHECGCKFPVDTAKFCIECGVKRLAI